jgi:dipeptidyl aminopeptidase/acylaminoacyl peptidase
MADGGKAVRVLDTTNGQQAEAFTAAEDVRALALSPGGKQAATAGKGGEVCLWDLATNREERRFSAAVAPVNALAFSPDGRHLATVAQDGTAVVWNLTRDEKPLPADFKLAEKDLPALWADLGSDDGGKAYAAARRLRADPARSVPFLQQRLKPREPGADDKEIRKLIADLDSEKFATREKAMKDLEQLGKAAEPALRAALAGSPSVEVKRRLEQLLKPFDERAALTPEQQRDVRAVRVLEQARTPEAKVLLEALTKETSGWWVAQEAKEALKRLGSRDTKP